jgi:hypothetical protein
MLHNNCDILVSLTAVDMVMDKQFVEALMFVGDKMGYCILLFQLPVYLEHRNFGLDELFLPIWLSVLCSVICAFFFKVYRQSFSLVWLFGIGFKAVSSLAQAYLFYLKLTGSNFSWAVTFIFIWIAYGFVGLGSCCLCVAFAGSYSETFNLMKKIGIGSCLTALLGLLISVLSICPLLFFIFLENYLDAEDNDKDSDYTMMNVVTPSIIANGCIAALFLILIIVGYYSDDKN